MKNVLEAMRRELAAMRENLERLPARPNSSGSIAISELRVPTCTRRSPQSTRTERSDLNKRGGPAGNRASQEPARIRRKQEQ